MVIASKAGARGWRGELQRILVQHNERHADREKGVSHRTREARALGLFRCFRLLHQLGYRINPTALGGRHVKALVRYWTAESTAAMDGVPSANARQGPLSAAYIQQQLSHLRVFARWIGKPGLVLSAERYVNDRALVTRRYAATRDKSWSGNTVDIHAVLRQVGEIDEYVGLQLHLMLAFGLRRKEAVMFCPSVAEVPAHALPLQYQGTEIFLSFLRVRRGTKGGRLRYVAVRTPFQLEALELARRFIRHESGHIGRPGLTLKQSLDRFSYVMRTVGVSKRSLGVTAHGLRHQFAADLYFELTHVHPPVRGGAPWLDPETRRLAYLEVARQLGHNRPQISGAYLGAATGRTISSPANEGDHHARHS
ncbi:integrase domain-containing protein [Zemynaea arenosa]|nr:integrase domain-containing protein [Massilia arenosa]